MEIINVKWTKFTTKRTRANLKREFTCRTWKNNSLMFSFFVTCTNIEVQLQLLL